MKIIFLLLSLYLAHTKVVQSFLDASNFEDILTEVSRPPPTADPEQTDREEPDISVDPEQPTTEPFPGFDEVSNDTCVIDFYDSRDIFREDVPCRTLARDNKRNAITWTNDAPRMLTFEAMPRDLTHIAFVFKEFRPKRVAPFTIQTYDENGKDLRDISMCLYARGRPTVEDKAGDIWTVCDAVDGPQPYGVRVIFPKVDDSASVTMLVKFLRKKDT